MKGDLHVHTNISDGSYCIEDTLQMAIKNQVTHIGITNHDTVKGLKDAIELGKNLGIKVIPGIEISAYDFKNNRKVHILGYDFNLDGKHIKKLCDPVLEKRHESSKEKINILIKNGYDLDLDYILQLSKDSEIIYKQHIMMNLIKKNYTESIYSDLYKKLFKNQGICSGDIQYIDALEAVKAIKKDGGLAVLAHPGQLNSYDIISDLVSAGLGGIEINHHSNKNDDLIKIKELSQIYNLILTGGSDFHGQYEEVSYDIGSFTCPEETLRLL